MLTIDLLRHGALEGGVKYRGSVDDALTEQGRQQMNKVWQAVCDDVSMIISSPLSRCAIPAQAWAAASDIPCVLDKRVQELFYGDWEGKTAGEIHVAHPHMLETWRKDPTNMCPPQGESMLNFSARIQGFLSSLEDTYQNEHILLVAHSGTIRMLIAHALQAPIVSTRHLAMPYACWSRLKLEQGAISLVFHAQGLP